MMFTETPNLNTQYQKPPFTQISPQSDVNTRGQEERRSALNPATIISPAQIGNENEVKFSRKNSVKLAAADNTSTENTQTPKTILEAMLEHQNSTNEIKKPSDLGAMLVSKIHEDLEIPMDRLAVNNIRLRREGFELNKDAYILFDLTVNGSNQQEPEVLTMRLDLGSNKLIPGGPNSDTIDQTFRGPAILDNTIERND